MEPATHRTRDERSLPEASALAPELDSVSWHAVPIGEALRVVSSREGGLTAQEATSRKLSGAPAAPSFSVAKIIEEITEPLREPLQLLLIVVGVLSFIWGEARDAIAIFVIIGAVAAVESISELRAKRALKALRSLSAPLANVLRDGEIVELPVADVVVGDVVAIEAGDLLPADCRVLHASGLSVDESALTGEASAAAKGPLPVASDAALAERSSMCFAGTIAVAGEARCLVVAVGPATELGQLGRLVAEQREPPTPLQRAMSELARAVLVLAVVVSILVPLIGYLRGQPFHDMVLAGLTLAFATIPEELPILVTVLLAIGGRRLAKRHALVRTLRAAETLGGVTVVVTDKTGTLTENRMRLAKTDGDRRRILEVAIGCQGVSTRAGTSVGDAVELALAAAATADGVTFTAEVAVTFPFDPDRKRMSKVWRGVDEFRIYAKGAPESVLAVCTMGDASRHRRARR
jgi:Ca2+-transporting ATPase